MSLAGQSDAEADVAAYLDRQGVPLSADFLTRYPSRAQWCIGVYPERTEELEQFRQTYGRLAF